MEIDGLPITSIPAEGDTTFPALDSITTFDLVGPVAANRQPGLLRTRDNTLRGRVNSLITAVTDINTGETDGKTLFLPRTPAGDDDKMLADLRMGGKKIINLAAATVGTDAMNRTASDARYLGLAGGTMAGEIAMGGQKVTGLGFPATATDAARRDDQLLWAKVCTKLIAEERISQTTLEDDDDLLFNVGAYERWGFRFHLLLDVAIASDFKFKVFAPSGAIGKLEWTYWEADGATAYLVHYWEDINLEKFFSCTTVNGSLLVIEGTVVTDATPGAFKLQWAQKAAEATPTRVLAGSSLYAVRGGN